MNQAGHANNPFSLCGINHNKADTATRQFFSVNRADSLNLIKDFYTQYNSNLFILSTCNRTELLTSHSIDSNQLFKWFVAQKKNVSLETAIKYFYFYDGFEVVKHFFRVISSIDSMVLGEAQITNQIKLAFERTKSIAPLSKEMQKLLERGLCVAKRIRRETNICLGSVSIASLLATKIIGNFLDLNNGNNQTIIKVLLIGSGSTAQYMIKLLSRLNIRDFLIYSQNNRAYEDKNNLNLHVNNVSNIYESIQNVDIILSATEMSDKSDYLIKYEEMKKIPLNKKLLVVDVSVPFSIDQKIANLNNIDFYSIDNFLELAKKNNSNKKSCLGKVEYILTQEYNKFICKIKIDSISDVINSYQKNAKFLQKQIIKNAINKISNGSNVEDILSNSMRLISSKLMHPIIDSIKYALYSDKQDIVQVLERIMTEKL